MKCAKTQAFRLISEKILSNDEELAGIFEINGMIGAIFEKLFLYNIQYAIALGP